MFSLCKGPVEKERKNTDKVIIEFMDSERAWDLSTCGITGL